MITFYANEPDNKHCLQAVVRMVVEELSGRAVTLSESEDRTGFSPGLPTWPFEAMRFLAEEGLAVTNVEDLDIEAYEANMPAALIRQFGPDVAELFLEWTNVEREKDNIRHLLENPLVTFDRRVPSVEDVRNAVRSGHLVIVALSSRILKGGAGHVGHFVLAFDADSDSIIVQDPGLPGRPNLQVDDAILERAMYSPTREAGSIMVVRRGSPQAVG